MADDDVSGINMEDECMEFPPGFRFHPTDEEIITHYLSPKVLNNTFTARAIGEVDLNKCEPWDLPSKARMGEREWYFFCQRDRKYPTGMRTNRATQAGYWKATGKDKEIYRGRGVLVGMKKTLVFYRGRAPRGHKTNWVMHEYRLQGKSPLISIPKSAKDEWVVCRVFFKGAAATAKRSPSHTGSQIVNSSLAENDLFDSTTLPPLADPLNYPNPIMRPASCFVAGDDDQSFDFKDLNTPHLHPAAAFHPPAQVLLPNAYSSFGDSVNLGYLHHQEEEMLRALSSSVNTASTQLQSSALPRLHCKMEQWSQDASGDLVDVASSSGLAIDWDNMCKF